jgi:hypothetical protein
MAGFTVAVTAKGVFAPPQQPSADWVPERTSMPYRWAHLTVTMDATEYATGGLALNVLGALTGWSKIVSDQSGQLLNNSVAAVARLIAANDATPGNRLVQLVVCSTGAEVASGVASTAGTFDLWVTGY